MIKSQNRIVCIAGASGLVGSFLLPFLVQSDAYSSVIAVGRSASKDYHPKVKDWLIWSKEEKDNSLSPPKIDTVFCCIGSTMKKAGSKAEFYRIDHDLPLELAKQSLKLGADTFVLISSKGADKNSIIFYNRVKGELERDLQRLNFKSLIIFRPSILAGPRHENRFGEKLGLALMRMLVPIIPGSDRFKPTQSEELAAAMHTIALKEKSGLRIVESIEIPELAGIEK